LGDKKDEKRYWSQMRHRQVHEDFLRWEKKKKGKRKEGFVVEKSENEDWGALHGQTQRRRNNKKKGRSERRRWCEIITAKKTKEGEKQTQNKPLLTATFL